MKKLKRTYMRCALTAALVLLVMLIAGSIWDLPISKFLYPGHESSIGQFFAAFGELPAFSLLAGCGVLLIVHRAKFRPELNIVILAFGVCLTLASIFLSVHEATDNVPALPMPVALLVTVFVDALMAAALLFLTRECQTKTILRFICTVIVVCVGIMLLINIIKVPWGRARMRLIYSTGNDTYFSNWWQAGTALKKKLVADGVSSDDFRSFPSGHTACAACSMLLILLPTLYRRLHDKEKLFMVLGGVWTLAVAVSRLRMGMHFLSDVYVPCEVCRGKRYNRETLEVLYKGKNIADILDMTAEEALAFFDNLPRIRNKIATLVDVGLGYIKLGQSATTLSGGEAQRVKLSTELSRRPTGKTIYVLDEPTTGLHFHDISKLLAAFNALIQRGHTIVVVEHNMDIIKCADWIVDLGPEAGTAGGRVVFEGTPRELEKCTESHTGKFLRMRAKIMKNEK